MKTNVIQIQVVDESCITVGDFLTDGEQLFFVTPDTDDEFINIWNISTGLLRTVARTGTEVSMTNFHKLAEVKIEYLK